MDNKKQSRGSTFNAPALPPPAPLVIHVVFTAEPTTLDALRTARSIAGDLHAVIHVLVTQVVPYPLGLACPTVPLAFLKRRLLQTFEGIDAHVRICFCRDRVEGLNQILPPRSIVVIGVPRRWWPFPEKLLAAHLRRHGHEVFFSYGAPLYA